MTNRNKIFVTKTSNESAEFSESKLRNSLKRLGATSDEIGKIIK